MVRWCFLASPLSWWKLWCCGEVNLCHKDSYLLPATIFSSGNRLHCLNLPMGESCLELLWDWTNCYSRPARFSLLTLGKENYEKLGIVSNFTAASPFSSATTDGKTSHLGTHSDHPVLALWKHSVSGKLRLTVGAQKFS